MTAPTEQTTRFELTFWGARGSSPVVTNHDKLVVLLNELVTKAKVLQISNIDEFLKAAVSGKLGQPLHFGGHTPCTEVCYGEQRFLIDMGSGLREFGTKYLGKQKEFVFFLTHLHWDHLIGLNFFVPIFVPGNRLTIYHVHKTAPDSVRNLFNGVNFPVKWEQLAANIEFREVRLYDWLTLGDVRVSPFALDHPGGSFGWRFEAGARSCAIGFDGEYSRVSRADLGRDLPYYQNLDLLVFDAQYELDELINKHDWGHSTASIGIDIALREGIKKLILIHHDPWASDERLRLALVNAQKYLDISSKRYNKPGQELIQLPEIVSAYDGLRVEV